MLQHRRGLRSACLELKSAFRHHHECNPVRLRKLNCASLEGAVEIITAFYAPTLWSF